MNRSLKSLGIVLSICHALKSDEDFDPVESGKFKLICNPRLYLNVLQAVMLLKLYVYNVTSLYLSLLIIPGPFGERDDQQVFVQKVVPETDQLYIRLSSTGQRSVSFTYHLYIMLITPNIALRN